MRSGVDMSAVWELDSELTWTEKQALSVSGGAVAVGVRSWVVDMKDSR
jgi:hypothetical protein